MASESFDAIVAGAGQAGPAIAARCSAEGLQLKPGKAALISGGESGHEPLQTGSVGHGMLDAACPGQVFTSPMPNQMLAAAESVDTGAGVEVVRHLTGSYVTSLEIAGRSITGMLPGLALLYVGSCLNRLCSGARSRARGRAHFLA